MNKFSYTRLVNASREVVESQLSHEDAPGSFTIYGELKYNRITGEIHILWCYKCPLSLAVRLKESIKFLTLCGRL